MPAGLVSTLAGGALAKPVDAKTRIPDKYSGLTIASAETRLIRTDEGAPQQFVFIDTNLDIDSAQIASRSSMWWHANGWYDHDGTLVFNDHVGSATKVALIPVEGEAALGKQHTFRFLQARTDGGLCLRSEGGVKSPGGFEPNSRFQNTLNVPVFPKETRLLGKGNIIALDGQRKLIVQSRAIAHLRVTLGRVPVSQFQHLASRTYGSFEDPRFSGDFSETNIAHRWSRIVTISHDNDWQATRSRSSIYHKRRHCSRAGCVMALGAGQPVAEVAIQALARNGSILKKR